MAFGHRNDVAEHLLSGQLRPSPGSGDRDGQLVLDVVSTVRYRARLPVQRASTGCSSQLLRLNLLRVVCSGAWGLPCACGLAVGVPREASAKGHDLLTTNRCPLPE